MDDFWSDIDTAVREARQFFERVIPRQYAVGHDGRCLVIMRGDRAVRIDVYGFLLARDRRDIYGVTIKRLGTA